MDKIEAGYSFVLKLNFPIEFSPNTLEFLMGKKNFATFINI